jgi:hypothetical protein
VDPSRAGLEVVGHVGLIACSVGPGGGRAVPPTRAPILIGPHPHTKNQYIYKYIAYFV